MLSTCRHSRTEKQKVFQFRNRNRSFVFIQEAYTVNVMQYETVPSVLKGHCLERKVFSLKTTTTKKSDRRQTRGKFKWNQFNAICITIPNVPSASTYLNQTKWSSKASVNEERKLNSLFCLQEAVNTELNMLGCFIY